MKVQNWNRVLRVIEPAAAAVFTEPRARRLLLWFVRAPRSAGETAAALGIDPRRLHYQLQKLLRLNLLEVVERRARAGRPIKYYRTVARAFFISDMDAPTSFGEALNRELRASLAKASARSGHGMIFTSSRNGSPRGRVVRDPTQAVDAVEMWRVLRLSREDSRSLIIDLHALLNRYQNRTTSAGGEIRLVHAAIARRSDQSGSVDNFA